LRHFVRWLGGGPSPSTGLARTGHAYDTLSEAAAPKALFNPDHSPPIESDRPAWLIVMVAEPYRPEAQARTSSVWLVSTVRVLPVR